MKLGMYSDAKRFPNSGGYVWISETNSNKFVSVYRGSLFEASTHTPTVILKLIYHWCCHREIGEHKVDDAWPKTVYSTYSALLRNVYFDFYDKMLVCILCERTCSADHP